MITKTDWELLYNLQQNLAEEVDELLNAILDQNYNGCLRSDERIKMIRNQIHNKLGEMYDAS